MVCNVDGSYVLAVISVKPGRKFTGKLVKYFTRALRPFAFDGVAFSGSEIYWNFGESVRAGISKMLEQLSAAYDTPEEIPYNNDRVLNNISYQDNNVTLRLISQDYSLDDCIERFKII